MRAFNRALRELDARIKLFISLPLGYARQDGAPGEAPGDRPYSGPAGVTWRRRPRKRMNVFERYLSLWVAACMVLGVAIGKALPASSERSATSSSAQGSQINIPIAILIWLMIYPMMLKIDFASIRGVGKRPTGLIVTLVVNWLVKPFSMAFLGWLFFKHLFLPLIGPQLASEYVAGVIILAAAPCTAMVFVWSYLSDGDPAYTLVQVSVNDLIMLVAFAPIVKFLVSGAAGLEVPFSVLLYSVLVFVVVPLALGSLSRAWLIRRQGRRVVQRAASSPRSSPSRWWRSWRRWSRSSPSRPRTSRRGRCTWS